MQHKQVKEIYKKPIIKVVSFKVENGFGQSDGDNGNGQILDPTAENPAVVTEGLNQRSAFSNSSISYDGF